MSLSFYSITDFEIVYFGIGDAELAEFLKEEIKMESQQSSSKMPSVDGFQVEKSNCDLTFTKSGTPEM